jgi:hypothetical protein
MWRSARICLFALQRNWFRWKWTSGDLLGCRRWWSGFEGDRREGGELSVDVGVGAGADNEKEIEVCCKHDFLIATYLHIDNLAQYALVE